MTDNVLGFPHGKEVNFYPCDVEPPCEGNGLETYAAQHPVPDPVNHPPHYVHRGVETIDLIEHVIVDYEPLSAFQISQVLKYICRAPHKGNFAQDIEKAHWYLSRLVRRVRESAQAVR